MAPIPRGKNWEVQGLQLVWGAEINVHHTQATWIPKGGDKLAAA